jgi:diacylglycerol O-acyltransferase-1
LRTSKR